MDLHRTKALALQAVQACLPYLDVLRRPQHVLEDVRITGTYDDEPRVRIRAMVANREWIMADCRVRPDGMSTVRCYITTGHMHWRLEYLCTFTHSGIEVRPIVGPDCDSWESLTQAHYESLRYALGDSILECWNVWEDPEGYAAFRQTWLHGKPFVREHLHVLADDIAAFEARNQNLALLPIRTQERVRHAVDQVD